MTRRAKSTAMSKAIRAAIQHAPTESLLTQIRQVGLPEPVEEYPFHNSRKWRADLAWPELWILAEVEGGIWSGGRHVRGQGYENDCEKYNEAQLLGFAVYRFTPGMIEREEAIEFLERAIRGKHA